jgi:hypothetical protein
MTLKAGVPETPASSILPCLTRPGPFTAQRGGGGLRGLPDRERSKGATYPGPRGASEPRGFRAHPAKPDHSPWIRRNLAGGTNGLRDKAAEADRAVIYYAGHGVEMNGENYLVCNSHADQTAAVLSCTYQI